MHVYHKKEIRQKRTAYMHSDDTIDMKYFRIGLKISWKSFRENLLPDWIINKCTE